MRNSKKLGAILTAANSPEDAALVAKWPSSAGSVFAITQLDLTNAFGLFPVKQRKDEPTLWEAINNHLGRFRGGETIGVALPNIELPTDFSCLQNALGTNRMELSWAFRAYSKSSDVPDLIILTTSLLPHILHTMKENDARFVAGEWNGWLHRWCTKTMPTHKYLDVTDGLRIESKASPEPLIVTDKASQPPPVQKPVKAKRKAKSAS